VPATRCNESASCRPRSRINSQWRRTLDGGWPPIEEIVAFAGPPYRTPTTRREALELALRWIDDANSRSYELHARRWRRTVTSFRELVDPVLDNLFRALHSGIPARIELAISPLRIASRRHWRSSERPMSDSPASDAERA